MLEWWQGEDTSSPGQGEGQDIAPRRCCCVMLLCWLSNTLVSQSSKLVSCEQDVKHAVRLPLLL